MHRSDNGSVKVKSSSGDIVCADVPLWACDIGIASGYASAAMWFMVLLPQLHLNYQRGHCHGLSLLWALANFTASLINVFFAYRLNLPLYLLISAAYMPILEAVMLAQLDGCIGMQQASRILKQRVPYMRFQLWKRATGPEELSGARYGLVWSFCK